LAETLTTEDREKLVRDLDFKASDSDEVCNQKISLAIELAKKNGYDNQRELWDMGDKIMDGDTESLIDGHGDSPQYKSNTVLNLVYPYVRNQAGLITDQRPQPVALPGSAESPEEFEEKKERAKIVDMTLGAKWEDKKMQEKLPESAIQQTLYADTFFHPYWNFLQDDVDCEVVPPHKMFIEPNAKTLDEADWIIYREVRTAAWLTKQFDLKDNFFDKEDFVGETLTNTGDMQTTNKDRLPENALNVDHAWTDEVLIIRAGKKIIKKIPNPFWEWRTPEDQLTEFMEEQEPIITEQLEQIVSEAEAEGEIVSEELVAQLRQQLEEQVQQSFSPILNYFDRPRKPFVHLKSVNDGKQLYSQGVMKQLLPVLQTINQRKQQIDDNANDMANSQLWFDGNEIDEATVKRQTVNVPGAVVNFPGLSNGTVQRVAGAPLPQYVVEDMFHSQRIFDDISGQHEVSRGAKAVGKQTATQVSRQAEADQVVVRLLVRQLEGATVEVFEHWIQLMKLFYTEKKLIQIHGINDTRDFIEFSRNDIDDGISIRVKPGSTLPVNKETRRQEVLTLLQQGLIAPVDAYEVLEFQSPEDFAERLAQWQSGQAPGFTPTPQVGQDPQQENTLLSQGEAVDISELDNHDLHMEVHVTMFEEIGNKIPPEIQETIQQHINAHIEFMEGAGGQQGGEPPPPA